MKTLVTDIQRFSLTDGDGIRTTVFLKGCNMHCTWCHNPETLSAKSQLMFYENKCIGCGKCFEVCPTQSHKLVDGKHIIDRETCISCWKCVDVCYAEALMICGKEMSVHEIVNDIIQDKAYYEDSNGGVTISGGEVLCNIDFAKELTDACHKENIKVAIETNLSFPIKSVFSLLSSVDLIMCDIKIFDDEKHRLYTGISNKTVLENIKQLDSLAIPYIIRTPLIPGVTATKENIESIAEFIKDLNNLKRYELLNFNPLGEAKYRGLDKENKFEKDMPLLESDLKMFKKIVEDKGLPVKVM